MHADFLRFFSMKDDSFTPAGLGILHHRIADPMTPSCEPNDTKLRTQ